MRKLIRVILLFLVLFNVYHLFANNDLIFWNIYYFSLQGLFNITLIFSLYQIAVIRLYKNILISFIFYEFIKLLLNIVFMFTASEFWCKISDVTFSLSLVLSVILLLIISKISKNERQNKR